MLTSEKFCLLGSLNLSQLSLDDLSSIFEKLSILFRVQLVHHSNTSVVSPINDLLANVFQVKFLPVAISRFDLGYFVNVLPAKVLREKLQTTFFDHLLQQKMLKIVLMFYTGIFF